MSKELTTRTTIENLIEAIKPHFAKQSDYESLRAEVDELENEGGQPNVIETVKVNGDALPVENKTVNVEVPTKVSELDNDADYQDADDVDVAIQTAISESGHAEFKVVDEVPDPAEAEENVLYLVKNEKSGYYDIYALIDGKMEWLDDTSVDLTDYYTKDETEEKIEELSTKVEASETNGNIQVDGDEVVVYTLPDDVLKEEDIVDFTVEEIEALLADN